VVCSSPAEAPYLARQGRQFRGEILIGKINPECEGVCVEQLHRSLEIGGRSDGPDLEGDFRHDTTLSLSPHHHKCETLQTLPMGLQSISVADPDRVRRHLPTELGDMSV
jgi:hypothetical protein